jgi:Na+/H+ antiporter NhaC
MNTPCWISLGILVCGFLGWFLSPLPLKHKSNNIIELIQLAFLVILIAGVVLFIINMITSMWMQIFVNKKL